MARTARVVSSTGLYAVILKSTEDIFSERKTKDCFKEIAMKYLGDGLLGIRFRSNYVHMFIKESEKGISMDMKPLTTSFARTYNRKRAIIGKVFADRFKSVPVEDDKLKTECEKYFNGGTAPKVYGGPQPKKNSVSTSDAKPAAKKEKPAANVRKQSEKTAEKTQEEVKRQVRRRNELPSWLL